MNLYIKRLLPIVGIFFLMLIVFWPLLTGGAFLNTGVIYSDLWLFNYPLKDWYRELLLSGKLPFWTSLVGNGYPVFAEGQVGALYPFHLLLFRIFPTFLAFNLNILLHYFLAAVFTFAFARVSLKLSRPAAFLSAIIYSLSGFFITHTHQINIVMVVSYLPLVFLLIERLVSTKRILWSFVLAIVVALQILAGHIEMFYYTSLLGVAFFAVHFFLRSSAGNKEGAGLRELVLLLMAYILGAGMCAAQILPTWELTSLSQRAEGLSLESASATIWPFDTLVLFVNPRAYDLYRTEPGYHPLTSTTVNIMALYGYIGIVPLLLALLAVVFSRRRFVVVFGIFLMLAFVYGFGRSTQFFAILWEVVPGLKFFRYPVKIIFFIEFSLAVLAAYGFDYIRMKIADKKASSFLALPIGKASYKTLSLSLILLGIVFVDIYANNVVRERKVVSSKEWLNTPEVVEFLREELKEAGPYRIYSHGTNNLDYQMARVPVMQLQFRNLLPADFNMIYRLAENREWFVLFLERQTKLNGQRTTLDTDKGELGLTEGFKRSLALQNTRWLIADLPIKDSDLELRKEIPFSKVVDHDAYIMGSEGPTTKKVPARGVFVYEYKKAYPRVLFAAESRIVDSGEQALGVVMGEDFDPSLEVVLEEKVDVGKEQGGNRKALIKNFVDRQDELSVEVETETPGFLVLLDTYYPGWKARVDGEEEKIYRADYAFRAVPIKAGKHAVEFAYEPTHWKMGFLISAVSLLVNLGGLVFSVLMKK